MKDRAVRVTQGRGKLLLVAICFGIGLAAFAIQARGSFGKARYFAVGSDPDAIAIGKLNGDGKRDIAVANGGAIDCEGRLGPAAHASSCVGGFGTVSILLGHGDGSFGAATDFPVGGETQPVAMVVGNFNADAKSDLALVDHFQYADSVSILLGKGDGTFGRARSFPVGSSPNSIAVGDVNQDSA